MVELCTYVSTSYIRQTLAQFKQTLVDKEVGDFFRKKFRYDSDIPSTPIRKKIIMIYHHIKLPIFWVHPPSTIHDWTLGKVSWVNFTSY
jgi:hypothetical protein